MKLRTISAAFARSPVAHRVLSALLLVGLPGLGAYMSLIEPTWLRVKRLTIPLPNLPLGLDGFRIVHLSDLHMGSEVPAWFLRRVTTTVQSLAPDAIVLTGDFIHSKPSDADGLTNVLQDLRAPHGVFAVLGNHDYAVNGPGDAGIPGVEKVVIAALERAGITVLRNEQVEITAGRSRLPLYGVDELWSGGASVSFLHTASPALPRIVLCHNPDVVSFLPEQHEDLVLCGHTHGGQVRLPPFPPLLTMTADRRYWGGLTACGKGWVFVSRGIGYTWRVRFAARPECVEITLKRAERSRS
jgi:predicted MPP superfamily phosphohydrolase